MSIIDYIDAANTLTDQLDILGHGAYIREDKDQTSVIYSASMSRHVVLFDDGVDVHATTDGRDVREADSYEGTVEEDSLVEIALWLVADVDPAAQAAYEALTDLDDRESVISDLTVRRNGLAGILLGGLCGAIAVDIDFTDDGMTYWEIDVDPTVPHIDIPPAHSTQVAPLLTALSEAGPHCDAIVRAVSDVLDIGEFIDAIGEMSVDLEVATSPDRDAAVISRGGDVIATIAGDGPWEMVETISAERSSWDDWTEMVAALMQM
jgi:hypothetical protein